MKLKLDPLQLYRLPWNLVDNASTWLEITTFCDLSCLGCYRENTHQHKTISEIENELRMIKKLRKTDSIAIAGGEPLLHPELVEIVSLVKKRGWKPCLVTNGHSISEDILKKLRQAGLYKITFHVDSKQNRPGWQNKNEVELNELRYHYAKMVKKTGKINCNFICTVYPSTLDEIEHILFWAKKKIALVNAVHFTCYRTLALGPGYNYFAQGKIIDPKKTVYPISEESENIVNIPRVVEKIKKVYPDFQPCTYLNGTEKPDSFKWLIGGVIGSKEKTYGYAGPKMVEIVQVFHHLITGRYFSVSRPSNAGIWAWFSWMWIFDQGSRRAFLNYLKDFKKPYLQTIGIVQPIDISPNGEQNMCDGCPDRTVWKDKLVYSCRLDECIKFGCLGQAYPKDKLESTKDENLSLKHEI